MNRTDELTDRLIDGALTAAEARELHELLPADPAAQGRHRALLRLELSLRDLRTDFELAAATVERIESERTERTAAAVLSALAARSRLRARGRAPLWAALAALAAAVAVAVWFGTRPGPGPDGPGGDQARVPAAPARVVSVSGAVEVAGHDVDPARPESTLALDQTLRTVGEESGAVLEFPDRTRVEVHPETTVRLVAGDGRARKLALVEGRVTAVAAGGPLVVGTAGTEVAVSRGSFALWSSGPGSARVEPRDGDVQIVRGAPAEPLLVAPGRAAFVRDERTPVRIEAPLAVQMAPRDRLNFHALDVGFAADGAVLAVSAKQWARWAPGAPDPGRTTFAPKVFNDGIAAWLAPDGRTVAVCRGDDRDERVSVRALPSGEQVGSAPVRVSEPRFLCASPDGSWLATAGGTKPQNRRVRVWDAATGAERFACELEDTVPCLGASPDGRWLAVGVSDLGRGTNNAIAVFDTATGARLFDLPTRRKSVTALAFTADGKRLAAGFNGAVQIWDVREREPVRTLEGFERVVSRLACDPRGELLAAATQDGQVWVWHADTGRSRQVIEAGTRGVRSVAFSADGKQLVTATNKAGVAVWDVAPEPAGADPDA
ncbi:MAG: FecR domain-containing protein [Gemmata sp.]